MKEYKKGLVFYSVVLFLQSDHAQEGADEWQTCTELGYQAHQDSGYRYGDEHVGVLRDEGRYTAQEPGYGCYNGAYDGG
jgi:hypothetical protein